MVEWGPTYFYRYKTGGFYATRTDRADERRIRDCRRVMKTRHGNCGEKSSLCATWLLENRTGNDVILRVSASTYDHAWVVYDHNAPDWDGVIDHLSDDAVVVDGWTGDYYPAKEPFSVLNAFRYGGPPNPFQVTVRYNILNASGNISVKEHVRLRDWTESFSPHFRLAYAGQPPSTYEPEGSTALRYYSTSYVRGCWDPLFHREEQAIRRALAHVSAEFQALTAHEDD
jgi:hypothetical protein